MTAGQEFCEADWSKLKEKYHSLDEEDLLRYCFSSAYTVALLHDSLGVALDDQRYMSLSIIHVDVKTENSNIFRGGSLISNETDIVS